MKTFCFKPASILMLLAVAWPAWAENVTVHRQPAEVEHREFDPKSPPSEMPRLGPGEAAITQSAYGFASEFKVEIVSEGRTPEGNRTAKVRVQSITVTPNLRIKVWVPTGATQRLIDHEEGHRLLSERFYNGAEATARNLARGYLGRTFTAEGPTAEAARKAAIQQGIQQLSDEYMTAIEAPAGAANQMYDRLTDHGRNRELTVERAMELAVERTRGGEQVSGAR